MNEEIFRKKSLDKIRSPEELNDYVRVTGPGVWLLLCSVIALLVGACIWGAFGSVETLVSAEATAADGLLSFSVEVGDASRVNTGMTVRAGEREQVISSVEIVNGVPVLFEAETELPDGSYAAEIVVESIRPFSFIFN